MSANESLRIDIDKLLRTKAPKQYPHIPKFVISYLRHIAHEDWLNRFLENEEAVGVPWVSAALKYMDMKVEVKGKENIPQDGKAYTFVSNHPLGGPDGLTLAKVLGEIYDGNIAYLVRDELMALKGLAPLCIPISKSGRQAKDFPTMVNDAFTTGKQIIMFPAGICSRRQHGVIKDLAWKKAFINKSIEFHRDIVPIHFDGRNSNFFYNLANISKALGIKMNIAMLYLVDEMYKNQHKTFTVTFGQPIPWQTFDNQKTPTEWAQYVKDIVYKL